MRLTLRVIEPHRTSARAVTRDAEAVAAGPRGRRSRWRAASLITVYVLMAAHVVHWKLAGRTLAPLELNEVLHTLELGVVTAGFIFMSAAVLSVLVFGRFFCSWGCHVLALQDLCAWILERFGIRPKPVRSRVLLFVPLGAMLSMFAWPHLRRLVEGRPAPALRVLGDGEGWASFVTSDFWRNLPGPGITILTFAVCGFAIVYALGSRSFCTYACPWGALFAVADRFAPGRIVARGDCAQCGLCTAACESHIRVHEEVAAFGAVVNPACLKDLDCVSACPTGALRFGFTRPALARGLRPHRRFGVPFDFTLGEDALMTAVFLAALVIFRGLYDAVPFLLTLAIGAIAAYAAVVSVRLVRRANVRFGAAQLARSGRLTPAGWIFVAAAAAFALLMAHSAVIRGHEVAGRRGFDAVMSARSPDAEAVRRAIAHLELCDRWGLATPPALLMRMTRLHLLRGDTGAAEPYVRRLLERRPASHEWRLTLAAILLTKRAVPEAVAQLHAVIGALAAPDTAEALALRASAHEMLGQVMQHANEHEAARAEVAAAEADRAAVARVTRPGSD
jgi:NAD-dependent dihydropyrimidine dehydrogenase PreA subunit